MIRSSASPDATCWSTSLIMGAEDGQLMWLHSLRIWPHPHIHISFVPMTLPRSVFCASTCNGTIAEANPTNAEKISASRRRLDIVFGELRSGGNRCPRGLPSVSAQYRGPFRRRRHHHHGLTVWQQRQNRSEYHDQPAEPNPLYQWIQISVNDWQIAVRTAPGVHDVQVFLQRLGDRHHRARFFIRRIKT